MISLVNQNILLRVSTLKVETRRIDIKIQKKLVLFSEFLVISISLLLILCFLFFNNKLLLSLYPVYFVLLQITFEVTFLYYSRMAVLIDN